MQEKEPTQNEPYEYHFFNIENLRGPIRKIVKELYPEFQAGTYSLIIGDDASGRIPALLVGKVADSVYKENGNIPPEVRFVAGSKGLTAEEKITKKREIAEYFEKIKETMSGKVLIVTDVIDTGVSLNPIIEVLKENGVDFDIASVGDVTTQDVEKMWEKKVLFGEQGVPDIFGDQFSSGVRKRPGELFSRPEKQFPDHSEMERKELQLSINEAREDVSHLADEILISLAKKPQKHK